LPYWAYQLLPRGCLTLQTLNRLRRLPAGGGGGRARAPAEQTRASDCSRRATLYPLVGILCSSAFSLRGYLPIPYSAPRRGYGGMRTSLHSLTASAAGSSATLTLPAALVLLATFAAPFSCRQTWRDVRMAAGVDIAGGAATAGISGACGSRAAWACVRAQTPRVPQPAAA